MSHVHINLEIRRIIRCNIHISYSIYIKLLLDSLTFTSWLNVYFPRILSIRHTQIKKKYCKKGSQTSFIIIARWYNPLRRIKRFHIGEYALVFFFFFLFFETLQASFSTAPTLPPAHFLYFWSLDFASPAPICRVHSRPFFAIHCARTLYARWVRMHSSIRWTILESVSWWSKNTHLWSQWPLKL